MPHLQCAWKVSLFTSHIEGPGCGNLVTR